MMAGTKSARRIGEEFAESTGNETFVISTRSESRDDETDNLYEESQAVAKFIKDQGITEVTLVGWSEGGDKEVNVATILQNDPDIKVKGLILVDSVGLYEQKPGHLARGFAEDSLVITPVSLARHLRNTDVIKNGVRATLDIAAGVAHEVRESRLSFFSELKDEVREMAVANPRLAEINIPIVIISGAKDPISDPDKIVPPAEVEKLKQLIETEEALYGKGAFQDPREVFLRENVFPNSPYIRLVEARKLGHHGLPLFREVADSTNYLLDRYYRKEGGQQSVKNN